MGRRAKERVQERGKKSILAKSDLEMFGDPQKVMGWIQPLSNSRRMVFGLLSALISYILPS